MVKKKVLSAIAFLMVAMVSGVISGGMVVLFEMHQGSVEAKSVAQEAIVEIAQTENEEIAPAEIEDEVQPEEITFSCEVLGCARTDVHEHGLCGIDGCIQIGEHSHDICGIAKCTKTSSHMHNGEYYYAHSTHDGHAYHNCGVADCTVKTAHTHGACGIDGCTQSGDHSHGEDHESSGSSDSGGNGGGHHKSSHDSGHKSGHH